MAKKYEFQPDKPYATWLSKLQLTKLQQKQVLKWTLYALILLILSVLQDVVLCRLRLWGGTTDLFPCAIFTICLMEGTQRGCVFSLVASIFYLLSGTSPGTHILVLITLLSVLVTALQQTYLHKGFLATLLSAVAAMAVYEAAIFGFCLLIGKVTIDRFAGFMVPVVLSFVVIPVIYPFAKAISTIGGESWKE